MALDANTNVAAAAALYFTDNFTALQQAGTALPPATSFVMPSTQAFTDWKAANQDKQFYLIGSGSSYKLGSVSGSNTRLPEGALAVDLNVAYAIESKELSLSDWMMTRVADDLRRSQALNAVAPILLSVPEPDVNLDSSSMSQYEIVQLMKRLLNVSSELKSAFDMANAADRKLLAAALGLSASLLSGAIEQQVLFQQESSTLAEQQAVTDAEAALAQAQQGSDTSAINDAQAALDAANATLLEANKFNEVTSVALAKVVEQFSAEFEAAVEAFNSKVSGSAAGGSVSRVVATVTSALTERLRSAADLALLATSPTALFGFDAEVQQTSDGNVLETAAAAARAAQITQVRDALLAILNDPALIDSLVEAMMSSAETLGTDSMSDVQQADLYRAIALSVVQAMTDDMALLDDIATRAVDFGNDLGQWLNIESLSATARESALSERVA